MDEHQTSPDDLPLWYLDSNGQVVYFDEEELF